ncbi:hypothetical protein [Vitiosangium sp. GDMCC 1.1324]|uniref:hypothetical protein n=1 Tax=Vitiosangium sp. (strain GDMCC 1.1324) TaxID=2138576 RepID=UPI0011B80F65|nr:hypothetical protein [Vitiosangium sp. GDMCC 1.1324]
MKYVPVVVLLSLYLAMSCGPEGGDPSHDAGTVQDSGTSQDAGTKPDAGTGKDSGTDQDSGTIPDAGSLEDAGTTPDAGTTSDAGTAPDAGTTSDAGTAPDAGPVTSCGIPYLGDINGPLDYTPTALGPDSKSSPIGAGSTVTIKEPPQGGRVSFIGVRDAINMDPCSATLIGSLKDPSSGKLVADYRTTTLERGTDGRGASIDEDISSFSNVTLCPNNWSSKDIFDQDYELTIILKDGRGKALQKVFTVRLACNVPGEDAYCRCICKQGYKLGDPCPP